MTARIPVSPHEKKRLVGHIGACLSDLVAEVHALVTEGERGETLNQRLRGIKASANSIIHDAEGIAESRRSTPPGDSP